LTSGNETSNTTHRCIICGREINAKERYATCAVCGALIHEDCADREVLEDSEGNLMCPYDAMLAALDWFDAILSTYHESLKMDKDRLNDITERLKNYLRLLE